MNSHQLLCGIELETEGNYMVGVSSDYWDFHEDGTLRGPHAEFVLKEPTLMGDLDPAFRELSTFIHSFPVNVTPRCGLHVHIDVRDLSHKEIYSACLAYTLLEKLLYKISGDRSKNKFCVPVLSSAYVRDAISRLYIDRDSGTREKLYSGLNLASIRELGSIEFRMHSGTLDTEEIHDWVYILHTLVLRASALPPEDIIQAGQTYRSFYSFVVDTLRLTARPSRLAAELDKLRDCWKTYETKITEQIHFRALQLDK